MARMNKEELKGGFNALFGEANPPESHPEQEEETSPQTPDPVEELTNTLTDEELKLATQHYRQRKKGRPQGTGTRPANYERITTIADKVLMAKMRLIAMRENLQIKEVLEAMMREAISTYEAKYGELKVKVTIPKGDKSNLFKK